MLCAILLVATTTKYTVTPVGYVTKEKSLYFHLESIGIKVGREGLEPPEPEDNGFTVRDAANYVLPTHRG